MTLSSSFAQLKDFKFKFYGQIRTDFYYNSRANEETVDGLFYMYPKDEVLDQRFSVPRHSALHPAKAKRQTHSTYKARHR